MENITKWKLVQVKSFGGKQGKTKVNISQIIMFNYSEIVIFSWVLLY